MMSKIPKLRFKEFSGEFESDVLDELLKISSKKFNPTKEQEVKRCIELEHLSQETGNLLGYINSNEQASIKNHFEKNQVLFGKLRPYLKKFWQADFNGVCSSEIWVLDGKKLTNNYLYHLVQTTKFDQIANVSSGSKMPRSDWQYMSQVPFAFPSKPEQEKIALFLTSVDTKIKQLTKKANLLEKYKKGVMQKIFNQEIRFKDNNGNEFANWEEKPLKKIFKERKLSATKSEGYEHISLTTEGVVPKSKRYERDFLVSDDNSKKYKVTKLNDICYNPANLKFGVIARNKYSDGIFSPIYVTFEVIDADIKFIEYFVTRWGFINKVRKYEEGTVYERQAVKPQDFLKFSIAIPTIEEQTKIANFLSSIDTKIEQAQKQLDSTKEFKKALLQQLFV